MAYWGEIRSYWRYLAAASLGQAAGSSLMTYVNNLFTPKLIKDFGWSRSDIALIGATTFLSIICQPAAGRLTDTFGVKRMATIGVVSAPLIFIGLSAMMGNLLGFFLLSLLQITLVGSTTGPTVYTRLIAQPFERARGIALGIAACAPAAVAATCVPSLSRFIDTMGWRAGYRALAASTAVAGAIAILLMPNRADIARPRGVSTDYRRRYGTLLRNTAFQFMVAAILVCNLSFTLQTAQLKVLLLDRGVTSAAGSLAVSLFVFSVIAGRLLCGVALDRFPVYAVAAISVGLPSVGLSIFATGVATPAVIVVAVILLGISLGGEGDILAYLVVRYCPQDLYSTALGVMVGAMGLSAATGSLLLSLTLKVTASFTPFLLGSALAALLGSLFLLSLKRVPATARSDSEDRFAVDSGKTLDVTARRPGDL